jgi:pyrroline-5-carboxylate reductase
VTYGVIGVGAIASAIVEGLCEGVGDAPEVLLSPRNAATAQALAARYPSVRVAGSNQAVADGCELVLLCLRPQDAVAALAELRLPPGLPVVSAMAGLRVADVRRLVAPATHVVRAIPLPSAADRGSRTALHPPDAAAEALFARIGEPLPLASEEALEALSAATAAVAAHFAYLDAIADWLVAHGTGAADARSYVGAIFAGLAPSLREYEPFADLIRDHATPGGLNERFRALLQDAGMETAVGAALDQVLARVQRGMGTSA